MDWDDTTLVSTDTLRNTAKSLILLQSGGVPYELHFFVEHELSKVRMFWKNFFAVMARFVNLCKRKSNLRRKMAVASVSGIAEMSPGENEFFC